MEKNKDSKINDPLEYLLVILRDWGSESFEISEKKIDDFLIHLKNNGWKRVDVYNLLQKTCFPIAKNLPEGGLDYISDVETSLIGHVAPGYIMRFPNENFESDEELVAYVRSNAWKK